MDTLEIQMQLQESKARLQMLEKKFDALVKILKEEGITSNEEVEEFTTHLEEQDEN